MEDPYPVENIDRVGVLMFQTVDKLYSYWEEYYESMQSWLSLNHKNTQPIYIFNRENPRILNHEMVQEGDLIL